MKQRFGRELSAADHDRLMQKMQGFLNGGRSRQESWDFAVQIGIGHNWKSKESK